MVIAARALGPTDYGILILVHGYTITVGGIVTFPGWHAVVRYGALARAQEDVPRLLRLLRFAALIEMGAGILAILTAAALAPVLGPRLGWSADAQAFAIPYSLAVLASVRATPAGFLQLFRRFDLLGAHNIVAPAVRLVGAALAATLGLGLRGFLVAWLAAALAEWLSLWVIGIFVARRVLNGRLAGGVAGARIENPGIWRFMLAANADITFGELAGRIAPLAVGWVLGPLAAGLYAVAQRATVIIAQPAQILGQAAYAELARLVVDHGSAVAVRGALLRCISVALLSALPVLAAIALFARPLATLLGGPAFAGAAVVMVWLTLARAVLLVAPPCSAALTAMGRPGLSAGANILGSLVLLPLLPVLMLAMGLVGAGVHAVVQAAVASAVLVFLVWRTSAPSSAVAAPDAA